MKRNLKRAFTLLEIMIAMTIFAVVMVAIYSSWMTIVRGTEAGKRAAQAAQRSRMAMRVIEDALLTTQLYAENIQYYSFVADTSDPKFAFLSLTAQLPATFPGSGYFGDDAVRRVDFFVETDAEGSRNLVMTQNPFLLVPTEDETPYSVTLARDINLFVLEFWDTQLNDWTDELLTTNQLPKMVRISMGMGPESSSQVPEIASRVIALPSMAVAPDVQRPVIQQGAGVGGGQRPGGNDGGQRPGGGGSGQRPGGGIRTP